MKYYISSFNIPISQLSSKFRKSGRKVKEYFISSKTGDIVAGDFKNYKEARSYLSKELLKRR